ncbi:MAG: ATP-binding protein, partial [Desulfobulbus sp.]|nr:ATP-binding protein [Desulfobulbus sp.]
IAIRKQIVATRPVLADPTQLNQILMNLCTNAFHALEQNGGILEVSLHDQTLGPSDLATQPNIAPGDFVVISISDTGAGISPEIQQRMFDPFFTTKGPGKGTGMGLSIAHGIIAEYGGFITCDSELGKGTVFRVFLPAIEGEIVPPGPEEEAIPKGREHILIVDDERMLLEMEKTMLEGLGYQVTAFSSSTDAFEAYRRNPNIFDAVITDQTMPEMIGIDLARKMLLIRPNLPIILCTGFSALVNEDQARALGIKEFATKPFAKREMARILRRALDKI